MTIDLFERYASLDPAKAPGVQPEWSAMTPVPSSATNWREPTMQTQHKPPTQPPRRVQSRRGLLVAAIAFVLILIVGAAVLLSNNSTSELPPATTPPTTVAAEAIAESTVTPAEAVAVVDAWYDAVNDGDVDRAMALFTPDAVLTDSYTSGSRTPADERMQYVWNAAQGTQISSGDCTTRDEPGPAMIVTCRGVNRNAIAQALGAPAVPLVISMTVTPDGILTLNEQFGFPDHNVTQIPFEEWMKTNNPQDAEKASFGTWTTIEEASEFGLLVARYAEEWATYLTTNGCIFQNECILLQARTPSETIEAYTAAYNAQNIEAVMALFTEESVVTGHPLTAAEARGISLIRNVQIQDMIAAATEDAYTISNVEVTGDTVTWDHVWVNNRGEEYCAQGQRAVIKDGTILTWTWPPGDRSCP